MAGFGSACYVQMARLLMLNYMCFIRCGDLKGQGKALTTISGSLLM